MPGVWSFSKRGRPHRHVGCGPVHSNRPASSALDSVLVAASLLGLTREDFNLIDTTFGQEFVNLLTHYWGLQNGLALHSEAEDAAGQVKDAFWDKYCALTDVGDWDSDSISVRQLWNKVMELVPKFSSSFVIRSTCSGCQRMTEGPVQFTHRYEPTPEMVTKGRSRGYYGYGQEWLQDILIHPAGADDFNCCDKAPVQSQRLWPRGPPAMIPLMIKPGMPQDFEGGCQQCFEIGYHWYSEITGTVQVSRARYRWRGGIYVKAQHHQVYFGQTPSHPEGRSAQRSTPGRTMFYDSMQLRGAIVGDVEIVIPEKWKTPAVLLFERID